MARQRGLRGLRDLRLQGQVPVRLYAGRLPPLPRGGRGGGGPRGRADDGAPPPAGWGWTVLRPWDVGPDPEGREPLRPFTRRRRAGQGGAAGVRSRGLPPLAGQFQTMMDEGLLDLDSRKGKAPGGYCETLQYRGRPFIFMNAVGAAGRRLHPAARGRARLPRLRSRTRQPLVWQRHPGLGDVRAGLDVDGAARGALSRPAAGRVLRTGGAASAPGSSTSRTCWSRSSHVASVDAFQSWIYTSGEGARRRGAGPGLAPDPGPLRAGRRLERARAGAGRPLVPPAAHLPLPVLLHRVRHRPARRAPGLAEQPHGPRRRRCARYREALALGNTRSLPEIYRAAGRRVQPSTPG